MVVYGGRVQAQISLATPFGSCGADLHSDQSFYDGKCLRMGHYAVILQPYFRFVLKGKLVGQQMAHKVSIGDHIHHSQHRRDIYHVDQELSPKVHASINASAPASYNAI